MTLTQNTRATDLLAELSRQGIRVWVDGAHMRIRAPKGVLTRALQEHLAERKAELIKHPRATESPLAGDALIPHQLGLTAQGQDRYQPFPLTDIQKAYSECTLRMTATVSHSVIETYSGYLFN